MKSIKKTFLSLIVLGLLLTGCSSTTNQPKGNSTEIQKITGTRNEVATAFIETLAEKDFDKLTTQFPFDEAMTKASSQLKSALGPSMLQLGELKEIQTSNEVQQGDYIILIVPVLFENQNICINVVFDSEDNIAGINFSEYVAPSNVESLTLPAGAVEIEMALVTRDEKELAGTLTLPANNEKSPVVILVHGSGPNDRNETLYGNTVFKDIAYRLAEQGIASYRYDKRILLYPEEMAKNQQATVYDETINDAVDAVSWIANQEGIDSERIYVLGHSLGGLCMPRIAEKAKAAGYIMMAAPITDLASLMRIQYEHLSKFMTSEEEKSALDSALTELNKLNELESLAASELVAGAYVAYWKDLLSYDPVAVASSITAPVLVLQGEEDYQVPLAEFEAWKSAYGDKENWEFHSYPGLSHMMMPGDFDTNPNSYYLQKAVVDQRVTDDIAAFINQK